MIAAKPDEGVERVLSLIKELTPVA
jgi:hypothetical protein